jgi:hypothetical protein
LVTGYLLPWCYPAHQCLFLQSATHDSHLAINTFSHQNRNYHVRMLQVHLCLYVYLLVRSVSLTTVHKHHTMKAYKGSAVKCSSTQSGPWH